MPLTDIDRDAIRTRFIAERGYWRPWTEWLLERNPGFVDHYAAYASHPARNGPLSERMVELIYVALDASSTHLFAPGLRTHLDKALLVGASDADILDVLALVASQGVAAVAEGVDLLAAELAAFDAASVPATGMGRQTPEKEPEPAFDAASSLALELSAAGLRLLERLDPDYLTRVRSLISQGRPVGGGLAPQERCLIEVALHACFTGFNRRALRQGLRHALHLGCDAAALLEAIQLGAHLSVHGTALGATSLAEATSARKRD